MGILLSWLVLSAAFWLTAQILPGFKVEGFGGAVAAAAVFGLLNYLLGWLLIGVIGIATLGIGFLLLFVTRWVVNALLLKLAAAFTDRLTIKSFGTAFVAGLLISAIGSLGEHLLARR